MEAHGVKVPISRIIALEMNREETEVIRELERLGILESLDTHHFKKKLDITTITCPDGTRIRHTFKLLLDMYDEKERNGVNYHPLTHHGSGLILVPNSSLVKNGHTTDTDFLDQIKMAVHGIGYRSVALVNHLPCKMARNNDIRAIEVIDALAQAKKRIKKEIGDVTVACLLQIASDKLLFMSKGKYEKWKKSEAGKRFIMDQIRKYSMVS